MSATVTPSPTSAADRDGRVARPLVDRYWVTLPDGREPLDEPEPPAPCELRDG